MLTLSKLKKCWLFYRLWISSHFTDFEQVLYYHFHLLFVAIIFAIITIITYWLLLFFAIIIVIIIIIIIIIGIHSWYFVYCYYYYYFYYYYYYYIFCDNKASKTCHAWQFRSPFIYSAMEIYCTVNEVLSNKLGVSLQPRSSLLPV